MPAWLFFKPTTERGMIYEPRTTCAIGKRGKCSVVLRANKGVIFNALAESWHTVRNKSSVLRTLPILLHNIACARAWTQLFCCTHNSHSDGEGDIICSVSWTILPVQFWTSQTCDHQNRSLWIEKWRHQLRDDGDESGQADVTMDTPSSSDEVMKVARYSADPVAMVRWSPADRRLKL